MQVTWIIAYWSCPENFRRVPIALVQIGNMQLSTVSSQDETVLFAFIERAWVLDTGL